MPTLEIKTKHTGEFIVYRLDGELIVSTALELKSQFLKDVKENRHYFAFDMSSVSYIDSSGVGLITNIKKKLDSQNGHLVLYSVGQEIMKSLEKMGLAEVVSIVADEEEFKNNFIL